jgi:hypothetical protein
MLTVQDYFFRASTGEQLDKLFSIECTATVRANAARTVAAHNLVLSQFYLAHPEEPKRTYTSGWRPKKVNAQVGGAPSSNHMTGEAGDLEDGDGKLDAFCMAHPEILREAGLYQEAPEKTPSWCHLQTTVPKSQRALPDEQRRRWFHP